LNASMKSFYNGLAKADFPPVADPTNTDTFNLAVYYRGAWTLHALRLKVGDETFFNILRTYVERFSYGNATTAEFIALAEELSGQDLTDFFDGWLYQTELPAVPEMGLEP
jgi:aminopeptidase N